MNTELIKKKILDLAIRGKLVEQRPEEGTAEELYTQIQEEKKKLIAEGKLKKEKPLPEITEDEIPFDIPENWKWVRLGCISSYAQTKEKITNKSITPEQWSLDLEDIEKETGKILTVLKAKERPIKGDKNCFKKGDILYSKLRPYLKKILVAPDSGICSSEIVPFNTYFDVDNFYLVYVLKSDYIDCIVNSATYGVKMPRAGTDTMTNLLIPLPPFAEQKRIVDKVEEIFSRIDVIEKAKADLAKDGNLLEKKILDLAIRGKLVEQRPEEGTAEELYVQIQEEKKKLIAEGKIKKEKPLPEILEDEIPFDIPESWKWVRLNDVVFLTSGKQYSISTEGLHYIKVSDMNIEENQERITKSINFVPYDSDSIIPIYSIIFPKRGGAISTNKKRKVIDFPICIDLNCMAATVLSKELFEYFKYWFDSIDLNSIQNGSAVPQINNKDIYPLVMPLPPLAEQKRIVAKLEEILHLCDKIK